MTRRIAAGILLLSSALVLTACDGDLVDAIESNLPTEGVTLPTLPGGGGDQGNEGGGAVDTPQPPAQTEEPPAQTEEPPPQTEQPPAETTVTDDTEPTASSSVPWWGWLILVLLGLTIVALVIASARRRRNASSTALASQADGQLAWVRTAVDDPLVRWRAEQLALPPEQRDVDSDLARRWALVDQRVTSATNDLLTIESGTGRDTVRQAAGLLRQAAEAFRGSVDGLARAVATGDQTRIATASQALTADTTLLDQGRQRLRQAAKL